MINDDVMTIRVQSRRVARGGTLQAGYTLIEILVVLFIISIVTSVALLSISHNESKQIESFAKEISQMVTLAEEQAMLESNVLGLTVSNHKLQFSSLESIQTANKQTQVWQAIEDRVLGTHGVPEDMQVTVEVGSAKVDLANQTKELIPQIIFSTNGDATPFTIYVGKVGEKPLYAVSGDADGSVSTRILS